ncbi:MAG: S9 family peptidase [Rhodanobacteraceae bacterium]|jgi:dipeptidyl aminopeptidase/acylaminoacyl peptidase|nr:MAG: S9 family peptidase [Rhodanobacteraceae bacterium]
MARSRAWWAVTLVALLIAIPLVSQAAQPFQLDDLQKLVKLSDPQLSPDGKFVAIVVSTPNSKTDKHDTRIDVVDVASGAKRTLTHDREDVSSPRWSPDGTRLAFLAKDDKTKQSQIYVMPMAGGDAQRITDTKEGVDEFTWSPDGTRLAYITEDPPVNEKAIKAHDKAFQVTDGNFLLRKALAPWHLWAVAATGGTATRLTQGEFSLQTDQEGATPLVWTRDGKSIVFTKFPSPYWGPSFRSVIAEVAADGKGQPVTIVNDQGANDFAYALGSDAYAFVRARNGDQNDGNAVYVGGHGKTLDATAALARNINAYAWLPSGKALLLQGDLGTRSMFWEQPLDGAARVLDLGDIEAGNDLSVAKDGEVAFIGDTPTHPGELYVMASARAKPRRLTDVNAFVDQLDLGRTDSVQWKSDDGMDADGVLTYPVGYRKGKTYPLVLAIHGGPEAASTVRFTPLTQLLAAAGFIVFQPNYRGSTNLGDAFQHAIYRDTGEGPGKDVMAGVAAVEKLGSVDKDRIGVSGWSYGGYMTTWLTGHYDAWKAAVSGAALTDWVMDYTVAYYQMGDTYFFGSTPWTAAGWDIWRQQSPITYARNVKAPTLIMGDVDDPNVPLLNSYEWYHALRDNGVTVEFWAYPADTHFPGDIVQQTDVYRRWVGWMTAHLK